MRSNSKGLSFDRQEEISLSAYQLKKIRALGNQEACAILCQNSFAPLYVKVSL